jgi:hypothetical protein
LTGATLRVTLAVHPWVGQEVHVILLPTILCPSTSVPFFEFSSVMNQPSVESRSSAWFLVTLGEVSSMAITRPPTPTGSA